MARSLCLLAALAAVGCTDGGTVQGTLPTGFLGGPDGNVVTTTDAVVLDDADDDVTVEDTQGDPDTDAGEVGLDADVAGDDVAADVDASDAVGPEDDVDDAGDVTPCTPGEPGCGCADDADCMNLDDGNLCNGRMVCTDGECVEDTAVPSCDGDTGNPCTVSSCDPASGGCRIVELPTGMDCDDGDACTPNDRCEAGVCRSSPRILCDDHNPCTTDSCSDGACTYTTDDALPCDDGNGCTVDDACNSGLCLGTSGEACGCETDDDCTAYDDADACNGVVTCESGVCKVKLSSLVICATPGADSCGAEVCNPETGSCDFVNHPNGAGCDDSDPCTVDDQCAAGNCVSNALTCEAGPCDTGACIPGLGICQHTPTEDGTDCVGEAACSDGATCQAGLCVPSVDACPCGTDDDCAAEDDDDLCNGSMRCIQGRCAIDPETVVSCTADSVCAGASCDPATGECTVEDVDDGTACDDGDACTQADNCVDGACVGEVITCDGDGPCVIADCHPSSGCKTTFVGGACDNGDGCTALSGCLAGQCNELLPVLCESVDVCIDLACDPEQGACVETANTALCNDGNPCTDGDVCAGGACVGTDINCNDGNPCTVGACSEGTCVQDGSSFEAVLCDDGNGCTAGDRCVAGVCEGVESAECQCGTDSDCESYDDDDVCTGTLICSDAGTCVVAEGTTVGCESLEPGPCQVAACDKVSGDCSLAERPNGAVCVPTGLCSGEGVCEFGACILAESPCDDDNPCTLDTCDPVIGCVYTPTSGSCDDGNPCTDGDSCEAGVCAGGSNFCVCANDAGCAPYDDADLCNGSLVCIDNYCTADEATVVTCEESGSACTVNVCDPATGTCAAEPVDGGTCSDGDACTTGDTCLDGACVAGEAVSCADQDGNPCSSGACDPDTGSCVYTALDSGCDDGNSCTPSETCQGGACISSVNDCTCDDDAECDEQLPNRCEGTAVCGAAGCELIEGTAIICDTSADTPCATTACVPETGDCVTTFLSEGDACGADNACISNGACTADGQCDGEALDCDDDNPCTADSCDPASGCVNEAVADSTACDDNDQCTTGDVCNSGTCTPGVNTCFCFAGESDCEALNDEGNPCTGLYVCDSSGGTPVCRKNDPVSCPLTGQEPCKVNECNPANGQCQQQTSPAGTPCDDNDPCTVEDSCVSAGSFVTCAGSDMVCDDGDDCTIDTCNLGECETTPAPNFTPCTDDDWCTSPNVCFEGGCGTDKCDCDSDSDCEDFNDDSDLCAPQHACNLETGRCFIDESSAVSCFDPNPYDCVDFACEPSTGACSASTRPEGTACEDADGACTINDTCNNSGACIGTPIITCNDSTPDDCEDYRCLPESGQCGFSERAEGTSCSDTNACTVNDICVAGACQGESIPCEDDNSCTEDVCSALEGCLHIPVFGPCDDGDPCTLGTYCAGGNCGGTSVTDLCGGCTDFSDCEIFDDGDACNGTWSCDAGTCVFDETSVILCEPEGVEGDPACYVGVCDPENPGCTIETLPSSTGCDDGDLCTDYDRCLDGACAGSPKDCDDGDPCTSDSCHADTGACQNISLNNGEPCDDRDACNGADTCQEGLCESGDEALCGCTTDAECVGVAENLCHGDYVCRVGQCVLNPASVVVCEQDPSGCFATSCVPETGLCESAARPDGTSCNDGDLCTADDVCTAGSCGGTAVDCTDTDSCTFDHCDADFGCVHDVFAGPCDDGNPCTKDDVCVSGVCQGVTNNCDDGNSCTNDICVPGEGCRNNNLTFGSPCDDGDICTITKCDGAGGCTTTNTESFCLCPDGDPTNCDSLGDPCTGTYTCDLFTSRCVRDEGSAVTCQEDEACASYACVEGACVETLADDGSACDDDSLCTTDDSCQAGACVGDVVECPNVASACQEQICVPSEGCLAQHASGVCTDSQNCTTNDHCVSGQCLGVPVQDPAFSIDESGLAAWTITSSGNEATWLATGAHTTSPPYGLHAVNPDTGFMDDSGGAWLATALLPEVDVPFGAKALNVRFRIRADFEQNGCEHQTFAITVNGAQVDYLVRLEGSQFGEPTPCESTGGDFLEGQVSLGNTYEGSSVELGFTVETLNASGNGGGGVIIDDVVFDWNCVIN
ncbi:MAG: hypothetical protein ACPGU1_00400 [Myxococcota bacterium]